MSNTEIGADTTLDVALQGVKDATTLATKADDEQGKEDDDKEKDEKEQDDKPKDDKGEDGKQKGGLEEDVSISY
jgi:hypothetical protein